MKAIVLASLLTVTALAQSKAPTSIAEAKDAKKDVPVISDKSRAAIRETQLKLERLQTQIAAAQKQVSDLYTELGKEIKDAQPAGWVVGGDDLALVPEKKPEPAKSSETKK